VACFLLRKHDRQLFWSLRSNDVIDLRQRLLKQLLLQEQKSRENLILRRSRDVHFCCQMAEKSLHFFRSRFLRVSNAMKTDEALDPINVSLLRANAAILPNKAGLQLSG
jgi:hypothetical protein